MKVSLNWLSTMVDLPLKTPADVRTLTERLDLTGTAVESVEKTGAALDGIVVGHILAREAHPNADTLWVTTVDVGEHSRDENGRPVPLQIVCGAQNFSAGDKVPVALVGTVMPGGMAIKKSKLRGVESHGMNCSARELGLGQDHEGIMVLPGDAPVGAELAVYLGTGDTVLDLEITPNRPDCMSMLGVAREVAAVFVRSYQLGRETPAPPVGEPVESLAEVRVEDAARCARYTARVIKDVTVGPSPVWLAERVTAAGARSINNIVDVTNYIMFELGQPLHAFDLDSFVRGADGRVCVGVRAAQDGERFETLDGVERELSSDMSVIIDGNAAGGTGATIGLAGVMGGAASEVTDATKCVLLESASFDPGHTSRTSRNLQLFSEAAGRFERGVDAATCDEFSARAAALIAEVAGGVVCEGVLDVYPSPLAPVVLTLRVGRLVELVGAEVPLDDITGILTRLGCRVEASGNALQGEGASQQEAVLSVTPPSYRPDLEREIDLYEEVLRIWGMERVEPTLPGGRGRIGALTREQVTARTVGASLRAMGLNETMTYAFAAHEDQRDLRMPLKEHMLPVTLVNPMNAEQGELRRSLMPGLLRAVAYNLSRGVANVHLYEAGTVFYAAAGRSLPKERRLVSAVLVGSWGEPDWDRSSKTLDFFDGKGVIEGLARELNIPKLRLKAQDASDAPWLQPGQAAEVCSGSLVLGWLGVMHPLAASAFGVEAPVVAFELEETALLQAASVARPFVDLPQFPAVALDIAVVVGEEVACERVMQVMRSAAGTLLDEVRLFDVHRDEARLGVGKKSLAFALRYRNAERTLTSEEVEKVHGKVLRKLSAALGAELRQ
ncbi:MAG: phenylalanine--tRNA ligase subunit beta [Coriobacteriales bacterium]|jgi:phenylalanyl-tRNA synthetase beta chain|nr:phenylalanine--tRNA ligase subunit beta [Coriobacteriales bacterium]